jgi:hypothetical protein
MSEDTKMTGAIVLCIGILFFVAGALGGIASKQAHTREVLKKYCKDKDMSLTSTEDNVYFCTGNGKSEFIKWIVEEVKK